MTLHPSSSHFSERRAFLASMAAALAAPGLAYAAGPASPAAALPDLGAAPEFTGIVHELRGHIGAIRKTGAVIGQ